MFKRIIYEEWQSWVPIVAFVLTAIVFVVLSVRAILMGKDRARKMANKPLEDDPPADRTEAPTHQDHD